MRFALFLPVALLCCLAALAQGETDTFPEEAIALIDRELPQMEKAVADKDRACWPRA